MADSTARFYCKWRDAVPPSNAFISSSGNMNTSHSSFPSRYAAPPSLRSARLALQEPSVSTSASTELGLPYPSPTHNTTSKDQKRKRALELEDQLAGERLLRSAGNLGSGNTSGELKVLRDPISYWIENKKWPKEYFDQDDQTRKDLETDSWFEKYWEPEGDMDHLFARSKSASISSKQSVASPAGSSSQKPRENKNASYHDTRYETLLATKGSFMGKSALGVTPTSKDLCRRLLETKQIFPEDSLFRDDLFEHVCEMARNKNEARVIRDISLLIVPSAEILAIRGANSLGIFIEGVNEGWNNSIPITKTRPQPDYSVAFRREAFSEEHLKRIEPFVGDLLDTSFFMATYRMYFPFLACEVKCCAAALDIADRQNAHSMTMAVRGIVELFRLVNHERELHREILAFSISHDHCSVRIYGHYPLIDGKKTTFYRHPIHSFNFTALDGKEKWTAYQFTKNVYEMWAPDHLKRICSVIDMLPPDVDFDVSRRSEPGESGIPHGLENHNLSELSGPDIESEPVTPNTSRSDQIEIQVSKKQRKRGPPSASDQD